MTDEHDSTQLKHALGEFEPVHHAISHRANPKIVHCSDDFKAGRHMSGSGLETLKDHLVGIACGPFALLRRAHGPGE